ncbi:hypothetical protein EA462_09540 [Natrarchaeobius halalkaliphilus]|uniref:Uncharacterized protein n=1 Tax=Natrarchaeobius halalkaliphilus TaxID=1679091 RepID=A0A3N6MXW2_9EURY|nr:hypothetical protein EA462_09540 [Natrarchaeobius halalkaliphilus]
MDVGGVVVPLGIVVAYGTAIGVFIDLDHFVIARLRTGDWNALRFCVTHPSAAVVDQDRLFDRGDVGLLSRLLSHLLITVAVVSVVAVESTPLGLITGVVLYVHIVTDVAWDIRRLPDDLEDAPEDVLNALR